MKKYKIYMTECGIECLGNVDTKEQVVEVLKGLDINFFLVVEHDYNTKSDNPITFEIRNMLKEDENVSRGTQKVYRREKS